MGYLIALFLTLATLLTCGKQEETDVLHFQASDVYPIYNQAGANDPTWAPDGSSIVFVYQNNLWSIPPEGGEATQVTTLPGRELYPNWSSDAANPRLVFVNNPGPDEYTIYTLAPGGEPQMVKKFSKQISSVSWSNDGEKIIFLRAGAKGIYTIPAGGGDETEIPNDEGWETVELAQGSPSRDVVLYVDQKGTKPRINSIGIDGGKPTTIITFSDGITHPYALAESYDGSTIAYTTTYEKSYSRNLLFVPTTGGSPVLVTDFYNDYPSNPTWTPDGKRLAIQMPNGIYMVKPK